MDKSDRTEATPPSSDSGSTRREALTNSGMLLAAGALGGFAGLDPALAADSSQSGQPAPSADASLYERLGGIFAIAGVVNHFSDAIIQDPVAGAQSRNPALRRWHTQQLDRLPGLKFMRTLWVANVSGGPFQYTPVRPGATNLGLENAHADLHISSAEFDAVAGVLTRSLDHFNVPTREKQEVLAAFAAHKDEVTRGSRGARPGN